MRVNSPSLNVQSEKERQKPSHRTTEAIEVTYKCSQMRPNPSSLNQKCSIIGTEVMMVTLQSLHCSKGGKNSCNNRPVV
ncbi:hypothetical protein Hanom_Chr02g00104881 [Helianthus anomalus]